MIRVEVLGPGGEVLSTVSGEGPVAVGSAADCDVQISGPSVLDRHLTLFHGEAGQIGIRDLGSGGATRIGSLVVREASCPSGTEIEVGGVRLRVSAQLEDATATASTGTTGGGESPAASGTTREARRFAAFRPAVAWGLFLLAIACTAVTGWITGYTNSRGEEVAFLAVGVLFFGLFWAGMWALGNRVFRHPFRFSSHLAVLSCWVIGISVVDWVFRTLHQVVHTEATRLLATGILGSAFIVLLFIHIRIASRWRDRWNLAISAAIVGSIWGLTLIGEDDDPVVPIMAELTTVPALPAWIYRTSEPAALERSAESILEQLEDEEARRSATTSGG